MNRFANIGTDFSLLQDIGTGKVKNEKLQPVYHTMGFEHREVPVITNRHPERLSFYTWGLIPFWAKDAKAAGQISNKTLNARGEELFDKPSFRAAAKSRRCLVVIDGFFEHHHKGASTFPYHIEMKDRSPLALAGLWETWRSEEEDIERDTFSIVTTRGNELLADIHNNPKMSGPRMPVIVPPELDETWLQEDALSEKDWEKILTPFPSDKLEAYTVPRLRGKDAIGNRPEAVKFFDYPELRSLFD